MEWLAGWEQILAILTPIIAGLAWVYSRLDKKFHKIDERIDKLEIKFDEKFEKLENKIDTKFEKLENKIDEQNREFRLMNSELVKSILAIYQNQWDKK